MRAKGTGLVAVVLGTLVVVVLAGCGGGGGGVLPAPPPDVPLQNQDALWPMLFTAQAPQLLDVRPAADFEKAHLPGSENAPGGVDTLAARAVDTSAADEIVVVAQTQDEEAWIVADLIDSGAKAKALAGGFVSWHHGLDINDVQLKQWIDTFRNIHMIDVRTPEEYAEGHIKGSVNRPLDQIATWSQELDPGAEYVMICRSGARSAQARDTLAQQGFQRVHNLLGGVLGWHFELECGG